MYKIVLDDIPWMPHPARVKERQFGSCINQKNSKELCQELSTLQKDLDAMRKRDEELSVLFKRLYGEHVLQRITTEHFRMLSANYNTTQKALRGPREGGQAGDADSVRRQWRGCSSSTSRSRSRRLRCRSPAIKVGSACVSVNSNRTVSQVYTAIFSKFYNQRFDITA